MDASRPSSSSDALTSPFSSCDVPDLRALHRLSLILNEFRKVNPDMPVPHALTLLTVTAHPGETVTEIAKLAGHTVASASRHIEIFGPWNPIKQIGLELMAYAVSPIDRRKKVVVLTPKGQRTVNSVIDLINRS